MLVARLLPARHMGLLAERTVTVSLRAVDGAGISLIGTVLPQNSVVISYSARSSPAVGIAPMGSLSALLTTLALLLTGSSRDR